MGFCKLCFALGIYAIAFIDSVWFKSPAPG